MSFPTGPVLPGGIQPNQGTGRGTGVGSGQGTESVDGQEFARMLQEGLEGERSVRGYSERPGWEQDRDDDDDDHSDHNNAHHGAQTAHRHGAEIQQQAPAQASDVNQSQAPRWVQQVASEMVRAADVMEMRNQTQMRLELNTGELGLKEVNIVRDAKGRVQMVFRGENDLGRSLVQQNLGNLRAALKKQGLDPSRLLVEGLQTAPQGSTESPKVQQSPIATSLAAGGQQLSSGEERSSDHQGDQGRSRGRFVTNLMGKEVGE